MTVRAANENDIEQIKAIFAQAREYFRENGIDQWQTGYPEDFVIKHDINSHYAYVLCDGEKVVAVCSVMHTPDPSYAQIDGKWHTKDGYYTIHRVAVDGRSKGQGLASLLFSFAEKEIMGGKGQLRADTHRDNHSMQRLLEKNGFERCGIIRLAEGSDTGKERIAFDKTV